MISAISIFLLLAVSFGTVIAEEKREGGQDKKEHVVDLGHNAKIVMVWVPAGEFTMGSNKCRVEQPPHKVRISKGFWIGKYEVTQEQYETVMGSNPSRFKGVKNPVKRISWFAASEFAARLNAKRSSHSVFRLPTEAEWEYACGKECPSGWYDKNSSEHTHPVGKTKPNVHGLYDMLGNVSEWCQDWYDREYYKKSPSVDPQGPKSGVYRVLRGGSWDDDGADCNPQLRNRASPGNYDATTGFRVVMVPGGPKRDEK